MRRRTLHRALRAGALAAALPWGGPATAEDVLGVLNWAGDASQPPIAFAEIELCREGDPSRCQSVVTGADGSFSLLGVEPGSYRVEATYGEGWHGGAIEVAPGGTTEVQLVAP